MRVSLQRALRNRDGAPEVPRVTLTHYAKTMGILLRQIVG